MADTLSASYLSLSGAFRCAEIAVLALAWVILCRKNRDWKLFLAQFAVLTAALILVNVLCETLISRLPGFQDGSLVGMFHIAWALGLGGLAFCYMQLFSVLRGRTRLLILMALFTVEQSIIALSGQCNYLIEKWLGQGSGTHLLRLIPYIFLLPFAWRLREYHFEEFPDAPQATITTIVLMTAATLLLRVVESVYYVTGGDAMTAALIIAHLCILLEALMAVHVMHTMGREQMELVFLQAEKQRFLSEREMARMTEAKLEDLRFLRHDLKNQYAYMQILLSERRYDELERYFTKLSDNLPEQLNMVDCGNHVMNTALNMEFAKVRGENIRLEHQLVVPPVLPFPDEDICAIISNLMDNAAEECRRLLENGHSQPLLRIEIYPHQSYLYIKCINTTDRTSLTRRRGGLITTKGDERIHGYGTRIISRLAEKYNGAADYSLSGERFIAQVMLDLTAQAEDRQNEDQDRAV